MPKSLKKLRSNRAWIERHINDPFVKKSRREGYRARSVYKLTELDDTEHLFRPGMNVADLGSAPGSWTQIVRERLTDKNGELKGRIIAMDILPMEPIDGVTFLQGDFREQEVADKLNEILGGDKLDVVISDIAPNFSGDHSIDHEKQIDMCESVIEFAKRVAKKDCSVVLKVLQGEEFPSFMKSVRSQFQSVNLIKPKASRKKSTEIYCVLKHFL